MRPIVLALFIACCVTAMPAKAQPPVKTGGGWAFTCKNGAPVYDGSGTAPDAGGSCRSSAGASSSSAQGQMLQGAFDAGVALNQYFARADQRARERRAARERARIAAEVARRDQFVRDSIAAARAREETWRRLSSQFQFSTAPQLEMRLGSPAAEIGFRFDGDTGRRDLSNRELMTRDATSCTFMACGEKTAMPELGDPMVVDLRHLRRATHLLRQTLYAPAQERESALDVATQIIEGGGPEFDVPVDAPELPPDAASEVGAALAERKAATTERIQRAEAVDTVSRRMEFLSDVVELARSDETISAAERSQLLAELTRQLNALDSALTQARQAQDRAEADERQAVARERSTLYRVARFQGREPASQARSSRGAPRWSLASASELAIEIRGEVSVYAAEPLVDNPEPRLPPPIEMAVRQRLAPDVLYVTGPTGVIEASTPDHRLQVRPDTRVAVEEVPLSTDPASTERPVSVSLLRGTLRWWSTVLDDDAERARLIETLRGMSPRERSAAMQELLRRFRSRRFDVRRGANGYSVRGSDVEFFVTPGKADVVRVNAGLVIISGPGMREEMVLVGGETATITDLGVTVERHPAAN